MKEAFKRYLYNILGCFIMLLDIASIIIFCLEYLGITTKTILIIPLYKIQFI